MMFKKGEENPSKKGDKSPNWKGGVHKRKDDYSRIWVSSDRSGRRRKLLHRKLVEDEIGRELTRIEVVHHINDDRRDNRLENLMVFPSQKEHAIYHVYLSILGLYHLGLIKKPKRYKFPKEVFFLNESQVNAMAA